MNACSYEILTRAPAVAKGSHVRAVADYTVRIMSDCTTRPACYLKPTRAFIGRRDTERRETWHIGEHRVRCMPFAQPAGGRAGVCKMLASVRYLSGPSVACAMCSSEVSGWTKSLSKTVASCCQLAMSSQYCS